MVEMHRIVNILYFYSEKMYIYARKSALLCKECKQIAGLWLCTRKDIRSLQGLL